VLTSMESRPGAAEISTEIPQRPSGRGVGRVPGATPSARSAPEHHCSEPLYRRGVLLLLLSYFD